MKRGVKKTKKEKIAIAEKICELYATDNYTLADCCKTNGVSSDNTFYAWCSEIAEIAELYKKAQIKAESAFDARIKMKARSSFEKRIEGFHMNFEEIIYEANDKGKPKVKTKKTGKKYYPPSDTLIQVALYNKDNFSDKRKHEHSGPDGKPIEYKNLTDELRQRLDDATS